MKNERPRVLIGSPVYLPRQGGASTYFSNLMRRLGDRVDFVVYSCRNPDAPTIERKDNATIYRIQPFLLDSSPLIRYPVLPPVTFFQLVKLRIKHGPMIIHAHACGAYGYLISLFSRIWGQEMIKEVQDMSDPAYNIHMGKVVKYVSTGTSIRDQLISFGVEPDRIITYPSLNPEIPEKELKEIEPKPHRHGGNIELVCFSALRPYKGVDLLLRSMKILKEKDPSIHLTVVGEGGMRDELQDYIEKNDLTNTTLRGFLPNYSDVLKMMAKSDILVLSSVSAEGNPRVILESFQFERPVIATAAGGTPELIEDDVNGRLVPIKRPELFAEAIMDLARDPEKRERLGKAGRRFLESLPTWDDLADEIYEEYVKIWKKM